MTAQRGRDLLLKLAAEPGGAFATVGGLRTHGLALNAQTVDATHQESAGAWRTLLEGAGVRQASIRGAGVFCDAQSDAAVRDVFFSGRHSRLAGGGPRFRTHHRSVPGCRPRIRGVP